MDRYSLIIGYIPVDWSSASDGSKIIMAGDTDHSKTNEYQYSIGDSNFKNETTRKVFKWDTQSMTIYNKLSEDTGRLSNGADQIPSQVIQNIYHNCLEEAEYMDSFIDHHEEDTSQFANKRSKYNGCFYCYYVAEIDDEIAKEALFLVKRK